MRAATPVVVAARRAWRARAARRRASSWAWCRCTTRPPPIYSARTRRPPTCRRAHAARAIGRACHSSLPLAAPGPRGATDHSSDGPPLFSPPPRPHRPPPPTRLLRPPAAHAPLLSGARARRLRASRPLVARRPQRRRGGAARRRRRRAPRHRQQRRQRRLVALAPRLHLPPRARRARRRRRQWRRRRRRQRGGGIAAGSGRLGGLRAAVAHRSHRRAGRQEAQRALRPPRKGAASTGHAALSPEPSALATSPRPPVLSQPRPDLPQASGGPRASRSTARCPRWAT